MLGPARAQTSVSDVVTLLHERAGQSTRPYKRTSISLGSSMAAVIRTLSVDDLEPLHALELAAQPLPWSDDQLLLELVNDDATVLGMLDSEHGLIGHVVMRRMVDELWVLNLCVHADHRRHGHARALLDSAMQHGRSKLMTSLWLEVRDTNFAARTLYASLGLAETAKRPEYYPPIPPATTREAAVLMSRAL